MNALAKKFLFAFTALAAGLICLAAPLRAAELTVSAAASLTNAFQEIKPLFEMTNPGLFVNFNFAASGPLLKQIAEGAPVDVFASADQETMDQAAAKKLIDEASRADFAANSLVMIVPADSKLNLKDPKDLTAPAVDRVAIGNPDSVPAGRYTRECLTQAGIYEALKPKFVLAESVRQVLDYVSRDEARAGFVYMTDAMIAKGKVTVVTEVSGHKPVTYPAALVAASSKKAEAAKFLGFLRSDQGQAVLAKYGFTKP